jgi:hypothetical protein
MDIDAIQTLYRDALSAHLKTMGLEDNIADFEATRILKRWIKKE